MMISLTSFASSMRQLTTVSKRYPSSRTALLSTSQPTILPRAAVAVVVQWSKNNKSLSPTTTKYLLVQRGNEPNKGMWSIPGGKIETGEGTLNAAKRELMEETGLKLNDVKWYGEGPFACSDSIHHDMSGNIGFHYVISQCFAEVSSSAEPAITASDDAMDARWWSAEDVQKAEDAGSVTKGVFGVISRAKLLHANGLLPCN